MLAEIRRWEREPEHPRRPRGRPGLSSASPELAERITAMRERGDSLHAIAETLNRRGRADATRRLGVARVERAVRARLPAPAAVRPRPQETP